CRCRRCQQTKLPLLDTRETRAAFQWVATEPAERLLYVCCSDPVQASVLSIALSTCKGSNSHFDFAFIRIPFLWAVTERCRLTSRPHAAVCLCKSLAGGNAEEIGSTPRRPLLRV